MAKDLRYYLKFDSNGRKVMKELGISAEELDNALAKVKKTTNTTKQSMLSLASTTVVFDGLQSAVNGLYGAMKGLTDAYTVQIEAERKLETVMRERMEATADDIQGIKDLASAQQELGVIGDEVQLAGAQQLATFLNQTSTLQELIPAMNNLVAQQKGYSATGNDAVAVANLMGKAMQGQASALRRVGITFTEAQEAMLKNGTESERAAMLADIITQNVGNMNAELAKAPIGPIKQLENALGDVKESIGAFISKAMPIVQVGNKIVTTATNVMKLTAAVKGATKEIKSMHIAHALLNKTMTLSLGLSNRGAAALRMYASSSNKLTAALKLSKAAVGGLSVAGAGLAIAAATIIPAINVVSEHFEHKRKKAQELAEAQKEVEKSERALHAAQEQAINQIKRDIALLENFKGSKAEEKRIIEQMNQTYGESMGYFDSVAKWYKALVANSDAYCKQMVLEARTRALVDKIAKKKEAADEIQRGIINGDYDKTRKRRKATRLSANSYAPSGTAFAGEIYGSSEYDQKLALKIRLNTEAAELEDELKKVLSETDDIIMPVKGNTAPLGESIKQEFDTSMGYENFTMLGQYEQYLSELSKKRMYAHGEELHALDELISKVKEAMRAFENGFKVDDSIRNFDKDGRIVDSGKLPSIKLPKLATKADITPKVDISKVTEYFDEMKRQAEEAAQSMKDSMMNGWNGIKGIGSGIKGISEAFKDNSDSINGNASAWERVTGIVDGTIAIFQGVQAAMQMVTALSAPFRAAKKAEGAAAKESASSSFLDAIAKLFEAHSWLPFVGIGIAGAMVGAMLATMLSAPKFAKGGIAYGPTLGIFGEYAGAANNPEVVAPLDKLRSLIQPADGFGGDVRFRIEGSDLVGVCERRNKFRNRI